MHFNPFNPKPKSWFRGLDLKRFKPPFEVRLQVFKPNPRPATTTAHRNAPLRTTPRRGRRLRTGTRRGRYRPQCATKCRSGRPLRTTMRRGRPLPIRTARRRERPPPLRATPRRGRRPRTTARYPSPPSEIRTVSRSAFRNRALRGPSRNRESAIARARSLIASRCAEARSRKRRGVLKRNYPAPHTRGSRAITTRMNDYKDARSVRETRERGLQCEIRADVLTQTRDMTVSGRCARCSFGVRCARRPMCSVPNVLGVQLLSCFL